MTENGPIADSLVEGQMQQIAVVQIPTFRVEPDLPKAPAVDSGPNLFPQWRTGSCRCRSHVLRSTLEVPQGKREPHVHHHHQTEHLG